MKIILKMSFIFKICITKLIESSCKQQLRHYPRWSHRKPVRILPSEKFQETHVINTEEEHEITKVHERHKPNLKVRDGGLISLDELDTVSNLDVEIKPKKQRHVKKKVTTDMLDTVIDANGDIIYTKMKNNDSRVGSLLTTVKSKKEKLKKDLVLFEGKRLIKNALEAKCKLEYILFSRKPELDYIKSYLPKSGCKMYKMPYKEMQMWSNLSTSPGIMGIFKTPDLTTYVSKNFIPLTIICDNIREPGNLGSVLRACAGVGCEKVILTNGCVDVWDTKVTRSSAGAHFHVQIHKKQDHDSIKKIIKENSQVFIADNKIISSNVNLPKTTNYEDYEKLIQSLPIIPYYGINYSALKPMVLIVGGETEGISIESYKLAAEYNGTRLNIPLENNIDSLNTGTALGIIMFEIKKQLCQQNVHKIENVECVTT